MPNTNLAMMLASVDSLPEGTKIKKGKNGNSESALQNKYYEPFYQKITRDTLHYNFEWSIHKNTFFQKVMLLA